jgi:hypothetical protein
MAFDYNEHLRAIASLRKFTKQAQNLDFSQFKKILRVGGQILNIIDNNDGKVIVGGINSRPIEPVHVDINQDRNSLLSHEIDNKKRLPFVKFVASGPYFYYRDETENVNPGYFCWSIIGGSLGFVPCKVGENKAPPFGLPQVHYLPETISKPSVSA